MSVLFLVMPITILISAAAVAAFVWATRSGQLDDLETPALRALHEPDATKNRCLRAPAPRDEQ
jgi:cbb3-type cytochrome oxidase maturation protein